MPLKDDNETETTAVKNEEIHENDVLMGRGGKNNRHIGNEKLRDIARGHVERYKVSTKKIKSSISRDIVKNVRTLDPPGRFLKRVPETGEWEDVGDYLAREKVAQVLRDAVCEATEATRPSIHIDVYPSGTGTPYTPRPAAGVFRQSSGTQQPIFDDGGGHSTIPGVVTASPSGSFGHPAGYPMPYPAWHPYGHRFPPQPYPGMPPFPPGYQPIYPPQSSGGAHPPYVPPGPHASPPIRASLSVEASVPPPQPPPKTQGTSAFGPAYSMPPSLAATAPLPSGTIPPPTRREASTQWQAGEHATPTFRKARRKRSRSLPSDSGDKSSRTSEGSSSTSSKPGITKKTSATQTPTFVVADYTPRGPNRPAHVVTAPPLHWEQPTQWQAEHPTSQQSPRGRVYYEQHTQAYYEPATHHPHTQPPTRSHSAPLPQAAAGSKESDSSGGSIHRSRPAIFSSRKALKRITRPASSRDSFESTSPPEQPGGSGTMEPLPAQPGNDDSVSMPSLPNPNRTRTGSRRSDRTSRATGPNGPAESESGLDWFQGQLLLESDEDSEDDTKDAYAV